MAFSYFFRLIAASICFAAFEFYPDTVPSLFPHVRVLHREHFLCMGCKQYTTAWVDSLHISVICTTEDHPSALPFHQLTTTQPIGITPASSTTLPHKASRKSEGRSHPTRENLEHP
jgi:hypothetical protein